MHSQDRSRFAKEGLPGRLRLTFGGLFVLASVLFFGKTTQAANPCLVANDVGQDLEKANKLRAARAQFATCSQKSCNPTIRTDCEAFLKRVDENMPTVVVKVVDSRGQDVPGADVTIDDEKITLDGTAVAVDPGQRTFQAKVKAGESVDSKPLIVVKEKSRVVTLKFSVPLTAEGNRLKEGDSSPSSSSSSASSSSSENRHSLRNHDNSNTTTTNKSSSEIPTATYVLGGVGIVALGAFAVFQLNLKSKMNVLDECSPNCRTADVDSAKQTYAFSLVSLGVAVVTLAGAAYFYFTNDKSGASTSPKSTTGLRLAPAPHGGGAALVF
jgi:hypothetical protein